MRGAKVLITGPTSQVATPIAVALAADNEVWGIARFSSAAGREGLEAAGVRCQTVNLAEGDFSGLPTDFDYVLNLAVAKSGNWDKDLATVTVDDVNKAARTILDRKASVTGVLLPEEKSQ